MHMKNIPFDAELFSATTYGRNQPRPNDVPLAEDFLVKAGEGASVGVVTNDEVPLIFACKGLIGAAKISGSTALDESFSKNLHAAIVQYGLNPTDIEVYMGPSLTFSHTLVHRELIEKLMNSGYRAACKRTDGLDFLDVPVLVLVQCRKLGILMEHIHISDYDTYENPEFLCSSLRGDNDKNLTVATLK